MVLLACAVVALAWANSPWSHGYFELWERSLGVGQFQLTLRHWINDGLMVVFFLLVGLEIKRELLVGHLSSVRLATLPIAAAAGGMLVPAVIYLAFNPTGEATRGWGIPVATDIAFALAALAMLGSRMPPVAKVFLTALAIADDMGAVLVIALFYTAGLSWTSVAAATALIVVLWVFNRRGTRHLGIYATLGVILWLAVLRSGVHATIAGVLLAAMIPTDGPLETLEARLHGVVNFGIMPLFALANAGVAINAAALASLDMRVVLGIIVGLALGKPIGIAVAGAVTAKARLTELPRDLTPVRLIGIGWLGGIGFTMALFVASLAFPNGPLLDSAKVGILTGSTVAGVVGWLLLRLRT